MFPSCYGVIYRTPENYREPDDANLATNTEYPNLNSRDYTKRPSNRTLQIYHAWECIALNEEGEITLATNKLTGREWHGSLWGFEADSLTEDTSEGTRNIAAENACFKLQCNSLVSCLQYVSKNIFLVALHSGCVQVWSTRSEVRNCVNPYCLFMIGEKYEHQKPITCLDIFKSNRDKIITGGKDCMLKIWDTGMADLLSVNTFRFAHSDVITGVASSQINASIFASCSLDKSALLWDDRLPRPAIAIYENHPVRFKAISWSPLADANEVYVGDEIGKICSVDIRKPNEYLNCATIFDRSIHKILSFGTKMAVIGNTNIVKAISSDFTIKYENYSSKHFVRDVVWHTAEKFSTVAFDGKMRTHTLE